MCSTAHRPKATAYAPSHNNTISILHLILLSPVKSGRKSIKKDNTKNFSGNNGSSSNTSVLISLRQTKNKMEIVGIIPARFASTRFPGKPLVDINGMTMIQRVYMQAKKSKSLSQVVVATDDQRIFDHVIGFGGEVVMTLPNHQTGTDRCREASKKINANCDFVINIQGDEPFIDPEQIDKLASCFNTKGTQLATLVKKITAIEDIFNKNIVKVVFNKNDEALYFSRSPIPHTRNFEEKDWLIHSTYYKHIGIYGYAVETLNEIASLEASSLEKAESLEQLRWLENGYRINVAITESESVAIDTPEDLLKVKYLI